MRKAQGGSRYSDWLHAILHKLEGDFRNAKMWYTDLGNNNAGCLSGDDRDEASQGEDRTAGPFRRFHQFWFVCSSNGGAGERVNGTSLNLAEARHTPRELRLTAHEHTDLVFLYTLATKSNLSSSASSEAVQKELLKHHTTTTESEGKIKDSKSSFDLDELRLLFDQLHGDESSRTSISDLTKLELIWLLASITEDFGWGSLGVAETVEAMKTESTPAHAKMIDERKQKATNMVFEPGAGQRRF